VLLVLFLHFTRRSAASVAMVLPGRHTHRGIIFFVSHLTIATRKKTRVVTPPSTLFYALSKRLHADIELIVLDLFITALRGIVSTVVLFRVTFRLVTSATIALGDLGGCLFVGTGLAIITFPNEAITVRAQTGAMRLGALGRQLGIELTIGFSPA